MFIFTLRELNTWNVPDAHAFLKFFFQKQDYNIFREYHLPSFDLVQWSSKYNSGN